MHLHYGSVRQRLFNPIGVGLQPRFGDVPQRGQFVLTNALAFALGETIDKNGADLGAVGHQHAITARTSLSRTADALLDDAAAELSIDEASGRPVRCLNQAGIPNVLPPGEPRKKPWF